MISWIIITFGNWWLAKLILKYTTKWQFILPLALLAVISSSTVVTALNITGARMNAKGYGEVLSSPDEAFIIIMGTVIALFYGLVICLVSLFLNRRKIMKKNTAIKQ